MPTSAAVLDVLYGLLEAEQGSIFRFMREGSPYLTRATVETRGQVEAMAGASDRHAGELFALIDALGGAPRTEPVHPENQYLSYLSLKFLLPKLAGAKRQTIQRYENALRALRGAPGEVSALLNAQLSEHRRDLATLESASAAALAAERK
jgi:hypothetical protein